MLWGQKKNNPMGWTVQEVLEEATVGLAEGGIM